MSSSEWTFCVCFLTCLLTVSVSYDQQQITVKTGDDVTLQCLDHRGGDIELLEWRRLDLRSYILFFRDNRTYENYQHPSFHGRVKLRDPQMKDGVVSVILKNVTINDTGTYECYVGNSNAQQPPQLITTITLTVIISGSVSDLRRSQSEQWFACTLERKPPVSTSTERISVETEN